MHLFVPRFEPGAVGHHTIVARDALVAAGHPSEIFAGEVDPAWATAARHYQEYGRAVPARPDDRLVYQVAIGSPVADWLVDRHEMLIANHHNFTPVRFLQAWDPAATHGVAWGRRQLRTSPAAARSASPTRGSTSSTCKRPGSRRRSSSPCSSTSRRSIARSTTRCSRVRDAKSDGGRDWLFVGRIAPNKCQHDLVAALAAHRRAYGSRARLHLVGGVDVDRRTRSRSSASSPRSASRTRSRSPGR